MKMKTAGGGKERKSMEEEGGEKDEK